VARTTGAAIAPVLAGLLYARPEWIDLPFYIAGTLKIVYDLALYRACGADDRFSASALSVRSGRAGDKTRSPG
jgi:hypothetical protein